MSKKIIAISGGSRGIGLATVKYCLAQGQQVFSCSRNTNNHVTMLQKQYPTEQFLAIKADMSREQDRLAFLQQGIEHFGRLDVLINNAATSIDNLFVNSSLDEYNTVMNTNYLGVLQLSQLALQQFIIQGNGGSILSIGSLAKYGSPSNACYALAKGCVAGLMDAINTEHAAQNIFANSVTLGFIETSLTQHYPDYAKQVLIQSCPLRRAGNADEVASAVYHIAIESPDTYAGQHPHISGGLIDFPIDYPVAGAKK